jgi:hypothetical protein
MPLVLNEARQLKLSMDVSVLVVNHKYFPLRDYLRVLDHLEALFAPALDDNGEMILEATERQDAAGILRMNERRKLYISHRGQIHVENACCLTFFGVGKASMEPLDFFDHELQEFVGGLLLPPLPCFAVAVLQAKLAPRSDL